MPASFGGKLRVWRYLLLRRVVQLGVLLLFLGTVRRDWTLAGQPVLTGNLSGSELLGTIPLADPFAVLQIMLTWQLPHTEVLLGAAIILTLYALPGGRSWCAWVCPVNMVTDLAAWLRRKSGITDLFRLSRNIRYVMLGLTLMFIPEVRAHLPGYPQSLLRWLGERMPAFPFSCLLYTSPSPRDED